MSPLGSLAIVFATGALGGALIGGLGWLLLRRSMSLRLAVLVPPLAAMAAVVTSVLVSTRAMYLTGEQTSLVLAACAGGGLVGLVTAVLLARRVRRLEQAVAEERSARAASEHAEQVRRQLVASLTHDLRTPLAGIRAMAEALEDGLVDADDDYLRRIREEVDRTTVMVDDLFELARLQAGLSTLSPDAVGLGDAVEQVVDRLSPLATARGVALTIEQAAPGLTVSADAEALQRVLTNLVVNAVRATDRARTDGRTDRTTTATVPAVVVRTGLDSAGPTPASAIVQVDDSCGGIAEDDLLHVFEAGWRGQSARTPDGSGAGLGLAIVRELVEAQGGSVSVTNTTRGCRFELSLPVCSGATAGTRVG